MASERQTSEDQPSDKEVVPFEELKISKKGGDLLIEHQGKIIVVSALVLGGLGLYTGYRHSRRNRQK